MSEDQRLIGMLLRGGAFMFGKRVELTWPEGLPDGMTEDDLRRIGEHWAPDLPPGTYGWTRQQVT